MQRNARIGFFALIGVAEATACARTETAGAPAELTMASGRPTAPAPTAPAPTAPAPARMVEVPVEGDLPVVLVRGVGQQRARMLFLPGMCVHPNGYVSSFMHAAAEHGDIIGMQGDVSCGGDGSMRKWSQDLDAMDRRVDTAFQAAGLGTPSDVVVIGYSQGAERAEKLAARWPKKYSRAVLIASPVTPSARNLARARSVVLMAGDADMSFKRMQGAVSALEKASVPATFFEIDNARHGEMGDAPNETMQNALYFALSPPTVTK